MKEKKKAKHKKRHRKKHHEFIEISDSDSSPHPEKEPKQQPEALSPLQQLFQATKSGDFPRVVHFLEGDGLYDFDKDGNIISHDELTPNACDETGRSLLHWASLYGQAQLCEWLISRKSDVNFQNPSDGCTALHYACNGAQPEVVHVLLQAGATTDLKDSNQLTPLDLDLARLEQVGKRKAEEDVERLRVEQASAKRREAEQQRRQADAEFRDKMMYELETDDYEAMRGFNWEDEWVPYEEVEIGDRNVRQKAMPKNAFPSSSSFQSASSSSSSTSSYSSSSSSSYSSSSSSSSDWKSPTQEAAGASTNKPRAPSEWEVFEQTAKAESFEVMEVRWKELGKAQGTILYAHVPFPGLCPAIPPSLNLETALVTAGAWLGFRHPLNETQAKLALRQAYLRWHPDKFRQSFGSRLEDKERDRILEHVTRVAQHISRLKDLVAKLFVSR